MVEMLRNQPGSTAFTAAGGKYAPPMAHAGVRHAVRVPAREDYCLVELVLVMPAMGCEVDAPLLDAERPVHGMTAARAQTENGTAVPERLVQFFGLGHEPGGKRMAILRNQIHRAQAGICWNAFRHGAEEANLGPVEEIAANCAPAKAALSFSACCATPPGISQN